MSGIIGMLLGSFPTAYLVLRWFRGIDIRAAGSGNVGALNSYEVSNNPWFGVTVLVIDFMKGVLAVFVPRFFWPESFAIQFAGGFGAVASHIFNPWLGFRGGKGLATAAGMVVCVAPVLLPAWGLIWISAFAWSREVNVGNGFACAGLLAGTVLVPHDIVVRIVRLGPIDVDPCLAFAGLMVLLMFKVTISAWRFLIRGNISNQ
jgi:glycerol-3-phosphate acyltransferase PlsY